MQKTYKYVNNLWNDAEAAKLDAARRALGAEIRALAAERDTHPRGSPEYQAIQKRFLELMARFKAGAGKAGQ